jgi:carbon storage regulator
MLILGRYIGQSFTIGSNIKVTILSHKNRIIRIGVTAPKNIKVLRDELLPYGQLPDGKNLCSLD